MRWWHIQLSCQLLLCDSDRSCSGQLLVAALEQVLVAGCLGRGLCTCAWCQCFGCFFLQNLNVVEQEKIDKLMLEMDGTENKCK